MSSRSTVDINRLPTGVPGLDEVLGGGLPEYSFNLIAGSPGTGKTTLAHQFMFSRAAAGQTALYFTVLGEPLLKMLRYQQQFSFFDPARVGQTVRFSNLSEQVLKEELDSVLRRIITEVEEVQPQIVIVDSFRTVVRAARGLAAGETQLQRFVQELAMHLTSWQATTFLVGEYLDQELRDNPVFTVSDGILWLSQNVDRNSVVRKLQIMKLRGQAPMPGLHTFRLTEHGLQVFPRIPRTIGQPRPAPRTRISTGVTGLDEMLGGGVLSGDAVLAAGPAGSGKTLLATQFIAAGVQAGEPGVMVLFEEHPREYLARAQKMGLDLEGMVERGELQVIYLRPLDLSVDETLQELRDAVERLDARRVVIDSLAGFELALAPTFREDFRESLYRLVGSLTGTGITVLMTAEVTESFGELRFSPHTISFLADDIILQRYIELDGQLRRVIAVVKMRGSLHSHDLRGYEITETGLSVGDALSEYHDIISGAPRLRQPRIPAYPGLTEQEILVLRVIEDREQSSLSQVAQDTGLRRPVLTRALARLVSLRYLIHERDEQGPVYRLCRRAGDLPPPTAI